VTISFSKTLRRAKQDAGKAGNKKRNTVQLPP